MVDTFVLLHLRLTMSHMWTVFTLEEAEYRLRVLLQIADIQLVQGQKHKAISV